MVYAVEWPADDYAIGSYIQRTVADKYLSLLKINPNDNVLDIGCGNGSYSLNLLKKYPMKSLVCMDQSKNMLKLARDTIIGYSHVSFEQNNADLMNYNQRFHCIVSFWCLQWSKHLLKAFQNMYQALKPDGQIFAILPTGDDAFFKSYLLLKATEAHPALSAFKSPIDYEQIQADVDQIKIIPFRELNVSRQHEQIELPSLETFRKFVNGLPFFYDQMSKAEIYEINEALVETFERSCKEKFDGRYVFDFHAYVIAAKK